jgi:hypothetical protein
MAGALFAGGKYMPASRRMVMSLPFFPVPTLFRSMVTLRQAAPLVVAVSVVVVKFFLAPAVVSVVASGGGERRSPLAPPPNGAARAPCACQSREANPAVLRSLSD